MTAAEAWAQALGEWGIPKAILDAAPEEPWQFPSELFRWTPEGAGGASASQRRAREALPEGGSVLDVGVGGGRASLPLVPPAASVTGVDTSPRLLAAFGEAAAGIGVAHRAVLGRWPDVADQVEVHDVVVCHHVVYNVADLVPFARALTDHARQRVVVELTVRHPMANLNAAWQALHGLERPSRPMAGDAIAVLGEMGLHITAEAGPRWFAGPRRRGPGSRSQPGGTRGIRPAASLCGSRSRRRDRGGAGSGVRCPLAPGRDGVVGGPRARLTSAGPPVRRNCRSVEAEDANTVVAPRLGTGRYQMTLPDTPSTVTVTVAPANP